MSSKVRPIPEDMHSITPHLVCARATEALDFYKRAFGATDAGTLFTKDGKLMHAMLRIGDSALMLMEENQQWGALGPATLGGSPVTIHLYVTDAKAVYAQAVREGATGKMEPVEMFWGDLYGVVTDPFGHSWAIATHIKDLTPEQIAEGAAAMGDCGDAAQQ